MPPPEPKSSAFANDLAASHFQIAGADLLIGGIPLSELAARYGTPLFIYDGGVMRRSYRALAEALSGFARIHYSVKANPAPAIIRLFCDEGAGVDIARRKPLASTTTIFCSPGRPRARENSRSSLPAALARFISRVLRKSRD
jgi:diaminopimelate decarboxylase